MKFNEQSYSGHLFRPRPEVSFNENAGLLIVATPWGSRSGARRAIQAISEFFLAAKDDVEVTSPFQWLTCLSPLANTLRTSVMLANDLVYNEDNRNEYASGIEILVVAKNEQELSFVQVGHPQIFLCRQGLPLLTVGSVTDLAFDFSHQDHHFPPLPNSLLGVHSTSALNVRTLRIVPKDQLFLISHSFIPSHFFSLNFSNQPIEKVALEISKSQPEDPFWLGQILF